MVVMGNLIFIIAHEYSSVRSGAVFVDMSMTRLPTHCRMYSSKVLIPCRGTPDNGAYGNCWSREEKNPSMDTQGMST